MGNSRSFKRKGMNNKLDTEKALGVLFTELNRLNHFAALQATVLTYLIGKFKHEFEEVEESENMEGTLITEDVAILKGNKLVRVKFKPKTEEEQLEDKASDLGIEIVKG